MNGLAVDLAHLAGEAADDGPPDWSTVRDALVKLGSLRDVDVPGDLRSWGSRLARADGTVPLLGLAVRAATYPGLLWNGARLTRAGLGVVEALTAAGIVSGRRDMPAADLLRAVRAGVAVSEGLSRIHSPEVPRAVPSTGVVAAAACVAIAADSTAHDLAKTINLAGTLMVVGPARDGALVERSLRAGHELAAGWLAVRLMNTGIVAVPDGLSHTMSTVTGHLRGDAIDRVAPRPAFGGGAGEDVPTEVRLADFLDELS